MGAFPAETRMNQKPKKAKTVKKVKKVQEPKVAPVDEVKVKPHCELFLADLPAPMRSVTTLAACDFAHSNRMRSCLLDRFIRHLLLGLVGRRFGPRKTTNLRVFRRRRLRPLGSGD